MCSPVQCTTCVTVPRQLFSLDVHKTKLLQSPMISVFNSCLNCNLLSNSSGGYIKNYPGSNNISTALWIPSCLRLSSRSGVCKLQPGQWEEQIRPCPFVYMLFIPVSVTRSTTTKLEVFTTFYRKCIETMLNNSQRVVPGGSAVKNLPAVQEMRV